jgi:uroporphyrinogen-III synthase
VARACKARVLVTRPAHLQQGALSRLTEAGYEPVSLPLLQIEPIDIDAPESGWIRTAVLNLDLYSKVIFISRNAARIAAELIDQYWPQLPVGVEWIAIGQSTANELRHLDIEAVVNSGIDSEALLDASQLQELAGQRILLLKGVGGRELLQQQLEARGAQVDAAELYQRTPCSYTATQLTERIAQPAEAVLLTSGESLQAYDALTMPKSLLLVVPSERVAQQAHRLGYTDISTATGASDDAMLAALEQRFS